MNRMVLVLSALALSGCQRMGSPGSAKTSAATATASPELTLPPTVVETAPVVVRKMPRLLTLTGSVVSNLQSEVAANVAGRVVAASVERGQAVRAGEVLAVVDSKAAGLSAAAASAQARFADTQLSQAKLDCERAEQLFSTNAIAKAEYDRMKSQCQAQLFSADAARAQAGLAEKLAGDTQIRAPFAGVVGERYVSPGEYVMPSTRVASVYALDPVRVSISVPEAAIGAVKEGQTLEVHVAAWPGRGFPAVVRFVSPALRAQTRDLLIEASAANKDGLLRPGMFATVDLLVGEDDLPTVPAEAVVADGTVKRIFLAREGQAFELVVRTGVTRDGRIAVLEPLDDKAQVIVRPPPGLHDGSVLKVEGK
jgi:membrane fusion protein (multidrug efflux system)